ncbi:MAG: hypothetical protein HYT93_01700 [Parcubacteria group bacterium]|nr:hypothetical protein [Parcubacteria group bacterium]
MSTDLISVHDGVANINPSIFKHRLVASTCPTTLPRDGGYVSYSFKFIPEKDSTNDLVLVQSMYTGSNTLHLFHIKRGEDGKVVVKEDPRDIRDMVGAEFNYQVRDSSIELRVHKTRFTSDANATAAEGESVVVVDAESILKFIAGYIKIRKLRSDGRRLQARISALQELQKTLASKDAELSECQAKLSRERAAAKVATDVEAEALRKKLRAFDKEVRSSNLPFFWTNTISEKICKILYA